MIRTSTALCLAGILAACSSPGAPHPQPEPPRVRGVWHVESEFQGRSIPANLILREEEGGGFSGVWESMGQEMELVDVTYEDGLLRFRRPMGAGGTMLAFEGRVVDGTLTGVQRGDAMEIPCTGSRFRVDRDGPDEPAPSAASFDAENEYLDELEADYDRHGVRAAPRDSFDVLDMPELVPAAEATTLNDGEYVLGVELGGEARAYPIGALGSSELYNDVCGDVPIAASW